MKRLLLNVTGFVFILLSLFVILMISQSGEMEGEGFKTILFLFLFLFGIIIFSAFRASAKLKTDKAKINSLKSETGASVVETFKHAYGLNFPEGTMVTTCLADDKIEFQAKGSSFKLAKSKIIDLAVMTDTQVQNQYTSSIGGAVAGSLILGPLGAVIGGRSKQKSAKTTNHFLIFTYLKDGENQYISFNVTDKILRAKAFINKSGIQPNDVKVSYEL